MTAATETRLRVTPLSGWTGALIEGVDLSTALSDADVHCHPGARCTSGRSCSSATRTSTTPPRSASAGVRRRDARPSLRGRCPPRRAPGDPHRVAGRLRRPLRRQLPARAAPTARVARRRHAARSTRRRTPSCAPSRCPPTAATPSSPTSPRPTPAFGAVAPFIDGLRAEHRFGATRAAERSDERIGDRCDASPWPRSTPSCGSTPRAGSGSST